jgi:hypothetical protein
MMTQVLKDHPDSAKAHYVAAEIEAKRSQFAAARQEFQTAERLEPGLPFARPDAVRALRGELFPGQQAAAPAVAVMPAGGGFHFPWGPVLGIGLIVAVVLMLVRRRQAVSGPVYGGPIGGGSAPVGGGYGPGYGYGPPPGGIGSGLGGSLASGLAVGAGVVAGEELAHRLLDGGGTRTVERIEPVEYRDSQVASNSDMGGSDFGVSDSSSWDDSGGDIGGAGGDDSWS